MWKVMFTCQFCLSCVRSRKKSIFFRNVQKWNFSLSKNKPKIRFEESLSWLCLPWPQTTIKMQDDMAEVIKWNIRSFHIFREMKHKIAWNIIEKVRDRELNFPKLLETSEKREYHWGLRWWPQRLAKEASKTEIEGVPLRKFCPTEETRKLDHADISPTAGHHNLKPKKLLQFNL